MGGDIHTNVRFGEIASRDSNSVSQVGVQHNYYPAGSNSRESLLDEFGPVNPRVERTRILAQKDSLLTGSCSWVFDDPAFDSWWAGSNEPNILWIHGDPGKGKTMIFSAVIEEISLRLRSDPASGGALAFFYCQRTDVRLNTAVAVLKGLIYTLIGQNDAFLNYVAANHHQNKQEEHSFWSLWTLLQDMFEHVLTDKVYLCIDALDECAAHAIDLLDNVVQQSKTRAHWLITSRNDTHIRERLEFAGVGVHTSLELNSHQVDKTVERFITVKVEKIARTKRYHQDAKDMVLTHLQTNARGTFLWVALVCKALEKIQARDVVSKLHVFPSGLDQLYEQMLRQIEEGVDENDVQLCYRLLRTTVISREPLAVFDLAMFADLPEEFLQNLQWIEDLIFQCGSFLTIRDKIVYFVHQSAPDFLIRETRFNIFPSGSSNEHKRLSHKCLRIMSQKLTKNICGMSEPGTLIGEVPQDQLLNCIPTFLGYACRHISYHIVHSGERTQYSDGSDLHQFFLQHLLHWLEVLCWLRALSKGILSLLNIHGNVTGVPTGVVLKFTNSDESGRPHQFQDLLEDANSFLASNRNLIELSPLQIYYSALIFMPSNSVIRSKFSHERSSMLKQLPNVKERWDACERTFEDHSERINSVAFSSDNYYLAGCYSDGIIVIWETITGAVYRRLAGADYGKFRSMAFSPDGSKFAAAHYEGSSVIVWDLPSGTVCHESHFPRGCRVSTIFTKDANHVILGPCPHSLKVVNILNGSTKELAPADLDYPARLLAMTLSDNDKLLAISSYASLHSWDLSDLENPTHLLVAKRRLRKEDRWHSAALLSDSATVVALSPHKVEIWSTATDTLSKESHLSHRLINFAHVLPRSNILVYQSHPGGYVYLWDFNKAEENRSDSDIDAEPESHALSSDNKLLAIGGAYGLVKVWNYNLWAQRLQNKSQERVTNLVCSPDLDLVACLSENTVIQLYSIVSGELEGKIDGKRHLISCLAFAPDGLSLASGHVDSDDVLLWDVTDLKLRTILNTSKSLSRKAIRSHGIVIAFSKDSTLLAAAVDGGFEVWDVSSTGSCRAHGIIDHAYNDNRAYGISGICFSADGRFIAVSTIYGLDVHLWDLVRKTKIATNTSHQLYLPARGSDAFQMDMVLSEDNTSLALAYVKGGGSIMVVDLINQVRQHHDLVGYNRHKIKLISGQVVLQHTKFELDTMNEWVLLYGRRLLKLPREMQPRNFAIRDDTVILHTMSGFLVFLGFDPSKLPG